MRYRLGAAVSGVRFPRAADWPRCRNRPACRLGVVGAAAATVLAQAVSAVMCLLYAFRKYPELHLSGQDFHAEVCVYAQHLG